MDRYIITGQIIGLDIKIDKRKIYKRYIDGLIKVQIDVLDEMDWQIDR